MSLKFFKTKFFPKCTVTWSSLPVRRHDGACRRDFIYHKNLLNIPLCNLLKICILFLLMRARMGSNNKLSRFKCLIVPKKYGGKLFTWPRAIHKREIARLRDSANCLTDFLCWNNLFSCYRPYYDKTIALEIGQINVSMPNYTRFLFR